MASRRISDELFSSGAVPDWSVTTDGEAASVVMAFLSEVIVEALHKLH
jgi:hypothetical protein